MTYRVNLWGDLSLRHPLSQCDDAQFVALRRLFLEGDLTIANFEANIHTGEHWPAYYGKRVVPHLDVGPWVTDELKSLGFNALFTANNKASDFGEDGILTTINYLDAAGIAHSGTGRNLTGASAPTYVATRLGRVAIIGAADNGIRGRGAIPSPVAVGCIASDEGPWYSDRPGVNMLRYSATFYVDTATMKNLQEISDRLGWEEEKEANRWQQNIVDTDEIFHFQGTRFSVGDEFKFVTTADPEDLDRNCRWIREARRNAELVIVGLHQNGAVWTSGLPNANDPPADHAIEFGHRAIDAGADIFVVHGAGSGAVEFYKGGTIIYGTAGLNPHHARARVPREEFTNLGLSDASNTPTDLNEVIVRERSQHQAPASGPQSFSGANPLPVGGRDMFHIVEINNDLKVERVVVHPVHVMRGGGGGAGTPVLVCNNEDLKNLVLSSLTTASTPFGTSVKEVDGVGVIEPI